MKKSIVKENSFQFALLSIDLYKKLIAVNEYVFSKQFIKSGTSIGANINGALAGQSRRDFIAKICELKVEKKVSQCHKKF